MRVIFEFSGPIPEGIAERNFRKRIIRKKSNGFELDVVLEDSGIMDALSRSDNCTGFRIIEELPPLESPRHDQIKEKIRVASELFRQERYWESHVILEMVWRNSEGDMKSFLRGLILVASSQVHYQMGHWETAKRMYSKGRDMVMNNRHSEHFGIYFPEHFHYPTSLRASL